MTCFVLDSGTFWAQSGHKKSRPQRTFHPCVTNVAVRRREAIELGTADCGEHRLRPLTGDRGQVVAVEEGPDLGYVLGGLGALSAR
jgi:hypothetical protein